MGCVRFAPLTDIPVCSETIGSRAIYGSFSEWVNGRKKNKPNNILHFFSSIIKASVSKIKIHIL